MKGVSVLRILNFEDDVQIERREDVTAAAQALWAAGTQHPAMRLEHGPIVRLGGSVEGFARQRQVADNLDRLVIDIRRHRPPDIGKQMRIDAPCKFDVEDDLGYEICWIVRGSGWIKDQSMENYVGRLH